MRKETQPLPYEARPRGRTRRQVTKWVLLGVTVLFAVLGWFQRKPISEHANLLIWQWQVERYRMPDDCVLEVPRSHSNFQTLGKHPDYHRVIDSEDQSESLVFIPRLWRQMHPAPSVRNHRLLADPINPTLFLGTLESPDGTNWIVYVDAQFNLAGGGDMIGYLEFWIRIRTQKCVGLFQTSALPLSGTHTRLAPAAISTIKFARHDPSNPSRLIIEYSGCPPWLLKDKAPANWYDAEVLLDISDEGTTSIKSKYTPRKQTTPSTSPSTQPSPH